MNPTIRTLALPVTVAAATLLQGCAAIPALIQAAASDPEGTKKLAKDGIDSIKSLASAPATAASAPAASDAPVVAAKAGITPVKACSAPATSTQGQAAAVQGQSPAARAAAAKLARGNKQLSQVTQLYGAAKDGYAIAKDAAGAIDGSCVTITVGRGVASKDGKITLANNTPKTNLSFNISAPNCTATNAAGNAVSKAWASVTGAFSGGSKAEAPANDACASDKATVQAELAAAGTKASADYRRQYKVPATSRVDYIITSNTVDLSNALTNAATGAVMPQIQQGAKAAGANLVNGAVRELTRK